jgi:hypothetical protein
MAVRALTSGAEYCIQKMHLDTQEVAFVTQTIAKYTPKETLCEQLSWCVYRVWNAIKYLFNASDWQVAKNMIIQRGYRDLTFPDIGRPHRLGEHAKDALEIFANGFLDNCLDFNTVGEIDFTSIRQTLDAEGDLLKAVQSIQDVINEAAQRARSTTPVTTTA